MTLQELTAHLDTLEITSENIGNIRQQLMMPFSTEWNAWVRDETAARENYRLLKTGELIEEGDQYLHPELGWTPRGIGIGTATKESYYPTRRKIQAPAPAQPTQHAQPALESEIDMLKIRLLIAEHEIQTLRSQQMNVSPGWSGQSGHPVYPNPFSSY